MHAVLELFEMHHCKEGWRKSHSDVSKAFSEGAHLLVIAYYR